MLLRFVDPVDPEQPFEGEGVYDPAVPFVVRITIPSPCGRTHVTYTYDREFLRRGLSGPVGLGEVLAGPAADPHYTALTFAARTSRQMTLLVQYDDLADFLAQTYECAPADTEWDIDLLVARLLKRTDS
ncbi:SsgA family sporulation/cell division regulator [Microbispora sp. NBRC 16548]|uniref:SsgA family sporulation/cell division regulator n=1 Tax=Microbispora sp. NBRC 16548 TaxID=3030994 RepID=UPI0016107DCE|nr:SsgA family sporulation/cell division regulator [Microbispora sp. NBRC 16548]GLX06686.1 hypothetical protein Misp03_36130 [Microbispora sp. NBRC 16548]